VTWLYSDLRGKGLGNVEVYWRKMLLWSVPSCAFFDVWFDKHPILWQSTRDGQRFVIPNLCKFSQIAQAMDDQTGTEFWRKEVIHELHRQEPYVCGVRRKFHLQRFRAGVLRYQRLHQ